jgi:DNA-binding response OmpR family regulator
MRILIAEDERDLNNIIAKRLRREGYAADACFDGAEALDYLSGTEYDAVVLDVTMPKLDGFALIRQLRTVGNTVPVLFLTAKDAVADRVAGLDAGANDYLVKPFAFDELLARLRVLLREKSGAATSVFTLEDLTLDCDRQTVVRAGAEIPLSAWEFSLLEYLMRNAGIVLSREKIENHIYDYEFAGGTNVVDVYIRYLRKKIDDPHERKLIHTVRGRGYVMKRDAR